MGKKIAKQPAHKVRKQAMEAPQWRALDQAHRKRSQSYENELDVDETLVEALIRVTQVVAERPYRRPLSISVIRKARREPGFSITLCRPITAGPAIPYDGCERGPLPSCWCRSDR